MTNEGHSGKPNYSLLESGYQNTNRFVVHRITNGFAGFKAYKGLVVSGVDCKTLYGKVMCGYQGWFGAPGDGSTDQNWRHWTKHPGALADGNCKIDLWPDVSDLSPSERFQSDFILPNGQPAEVFSSYLRSTVLRHFEWMKQYGIDGVFVQRFGTELHSQTSLERCNTVLNNCREGANLNGRTYAVMYDLSGLSGGQLKEIVSDWHKLKETMAITEDPSYLHHNGKPVVGVWGVGFNDHRGYTLEDCRSLLAALKEDPEFGGCTIVIGVPAHWLELEKDAVPDPKLLEIIAMADVVSPWTVGRYTDLSGVDAYERNELKANMAWCKQRKMDFMPVVFPGFSWYNMYGKTFNQIPRLGGQFIWSQFLGAKRAGASMVYVAMFDEVDEGTAIFKCSNEVPSAQESKFLTLEGLPSDSYLRLVGCGARLLQGSMPIEMVKDVTAALAVTPEVAASPDTFGRREGHPRIDISEIKPKSN